MKKNKKLIKIAALVLSAATIGTLTACGDARLPRTFTVTFNSGIGGSEVKSQTVKEGYLLKEFDEPTNTASDYIFRGWYSDETFETPFDVKTYRVFEDLTLYAKWTFPTFAPQEIELGSDAFTHSVSWVQKGVAGNTSDISVKAYEGELKYHYSYDANYDKNVIDGVEIEYDTSSAPVTLDGVVTTKGDYEVSFTVSNPKNCYYWIIVHSNTNSFDDVEIKDIHFKGDGTVDNPYLIYNSTDLEYLTTNSFDENTYAELKADVTLKSIYSSKKNCVFNGHLSGSKSNALIKSNDTYTITLKNDSALFHTLGEKGVIENVGFAGSLSGNNPSMGVAANYSYGTITKVDSKAVSVKSQGGKVNDITTIAQGGSGGIVGTNYGKIKDCTVSSARDNVIQGHIAVGGVAGVNYGEISDMRVDAIVGAYNGNEISLTIENSFSGTVAGVNYGTISKIDVYNGKINVRRIDKGTEGEGATNVGGIVGYNAQTGIVSECVFDGMRIVGDTNVGGIAGYNDGTVESCYTGRRLRKPSNTSVMERQFISPVIGSYNVGGIVGKCGPNSVVKNVFSTANVWSYGMPGYTVAEKAENSIGVKYNMRPRVASDYLGQKYGVVYSNELTAPNGQNNIFIDNENMVGMSVSWGLGFKVSNGGSLVADYQLVKEYLTLLGDKFGFRDSASHGIRLRWENTAVKALGDIVIPED